MSARRLLDRVNGVLTRVNARSENAPLKLLG